ncbi:helix-turn-helix transcriptional regulator [Hyphomicrobium sp.]|uniref:helix-turn-helix domain-containing protein n=1 Tax=Hyphomicrobium sp. TaxID=82 RepID=UPI0025BEB2A8|nr:helix-turn-helix transcriptional regulator [Hyphomicrobium sp.]
MPLRPRWSHIGRSIASQNLSQSEAAKRMGLSQPDVSKLLKGQFRPFSIERLMRLLTTLGQDVKMEVVEPRSPRKKGKLTVEA